MSRLIVVLMQSNEYPFGECDNSNLEKKKIMVRKIVAFHPLHKISIVSKAKKLKSFTNPYLIKLQQLLEEDSTLHLLYQYVPIKIETWISNLNSQFIENFHCKLRELANFFIANQIVIDFRLKNIGMDQNYNPKYFIGLDYEINCEISSADLSNKYSHQIKQILYPLAQNKKQIPQSLQHPTIRREIPKRPNNNEVALNNNLKQNQHRLNRIEKFQLSQQNQIKKTEAKKESIRPVKIKEEPVLEKFITPKIAANVKIQNIGRKINDLKNIMSTFNREGRRKADSESASPMKNMVEERFNSTQKQLPKCQNQLLRQNSANVSKNDIHFGVYEDELKKSKQFRETRSETDFQFKYTYPNALDEEEDNHFLSKQIKCKGSGTFFPEAKKSYIFEFQKLLNENDDPIFDDDSGNHLANDQHSPEYQMIQNRINNPVKIENMKTQPERNSYSYSTIRRKRSGGSLIEEKVTLQRVKQVLNTSKKLINKFKRPYINQCVNNN